MKKLLLLGKEIDYENSKILLKSAPDENWRNDWVPMSGTWDYKDGYLIGYEQGNFGGILFSKQSFDKNIMMTYKVSTVLPATRDVNAVFCAHWDEKTDYLGVSYVCGLNGWYENKSGIERNEGFCALTSSYYYEPGTEIEMTVGAINGHCFMFVDGKLITEYIDENPILDGHIGFSAYCTMLKIRDIEIREISYKERVQLYDPEFDV